jgi:ATP-dependent RNA helicase DDX27
VTLVGEADRKMLKAAIKHGAEADQVRHRIVPPEAVAKWVEKLDELKGEISEILKEEKEEKQVTISSPLSRPILCSHLLSSAKQKWS